MAVLNFYHLSKVIPDNAVYIGRAMPHFGLKQSKFANPFKLSKEEPRGPQLNDTVFGCGNRSGSGKLPLKIFLLWKVKIWYASVIPIHVTETYLKRL